MGTRDKLAVQRTKLANERTLLAYVRTAIVCFATGLTMIKLVSHDPLIIFVALILLIASVGMVFMGIYTYLRTSMEIRGSYLAIVKPQILKFPSFFKTFEASLRVEPVVKTSSKITTEL